jgi:Putative amidoligase enzyme
MREAKMVELLRVRPKPGEVGIEIELEGNGVGQIVANNMWNTEMDGSLRGESIELVLKAPAPRHLIPARLNKMKEMVSHCAIKDTGRAGIHIHVNIQDLTPREYAQFLVMYLIFEEVLVDWCGTDRVGNLFCLRASDANYGLQIIRSALQSFRFGLLDTDGIRYASINLKATATYGSLEFRALRSTTDVDVILKWIYILLKLKDTARKYESPADIVEELSVLGVEGFFNEILGEFEIPFDHMQVMSGVRNAQYIAYCRNDWSCMLPGQVKAPEIKLNDPLANAPGGIQEEINRIVRDLNEMRMDPVVIRRPLR